MRSERVEMVEKWVIMENGKVSWVERKWDEVVILVVRCMIRIVVRFLWR